jgi:hypothetical protein
MGVFCYFGLKRVISDCFKESILSLLHQNMEHKMKRTLQTLFAGLAAIFAVTENAWAGIPVAGWAVPYVLSVALAMFAVMGVTAMLKPSDVMFKDINSENSSSAAVIGRYLSLAAGALFMCVFGVGVVGALVA